MVAAGAIAVGALAVGGLPVLTGVKTRPLSPGGSVWLTIRLTLARLKQCIGAFSGETFVPYGVILVWVSAVGGLLTLALFTSSRSRRALIVLGMSILALPIVFESPQINAVGTYWQGRYWLPLAIGIPLVASSCAVFPSPSVLFARRSARVLGVLAFVSILVIAQLAAILTELHRYETGLDQPPGAPSAGCLPEGALLSSRCSCSAKPCSWRFYCGSSFFLGGGSVSRSCRAVGPAAGRIRSLRPPLWNAMTRGDARMAEKRWRKRVSGHCHLRSLEQQSDVGRNELDAVNFQAKHQDLARRPPFAGAG